MSKIVGLCEGSPKRGLRKKFKMKNKINDVRGFSKCFSLHFEVPIHVILENKLFSLLDSS